MKLSGTARQVWIYIEESDTWHGQPLWLVILERLKKAGCPGGTVLRGLAGFGAHRTVHTATLVELSANLPLVVTFIEHPHRFAETFGAIAELVREGLVVVNDVQVMPSALPSSFPAFKVSEVMTREAVHIQGHSPIRQAFDLLVSRRLRALPVVDGQGHLTGILTDGDLFHKGGIPIPARFHWELPASEQQSTFTEERRVDQIMTASPTVIAPDATLAQAAALMVARRIKRLPVVDPAGKLLGILSRSDLLRTISEDARTAPQPTTAPTTPEALPVSPVPIIGPETPLPEILEKLLTTEKRRVMICDPQQHPLGLITDGDVLRRVGRIVKPAFLRSLVARLSGGQALDALELTGTTYLAKDLMSSPLLTLASSATLQEAARLLMIHSFKHIPVLGPEGQLLGLVGRADVLRALHSAD